MRVLLAIDGSPHGDAIVDETSGRYWASGTEMEVLIVIHSQFPLVPDPAFTRVASSAEAACRVPERAATLVGTVANRLRKRQPRTVVTTKVLEGHPTEMILREAHQWRADLIIMGSHGHSGAWQARLGSTASSVAAAAPCTVEIIRSHQRQVRVHDPETVPHPVHLDGSMGAPLEGHDASSDNLLL